MSPRLTNAQVAAEAIKAERDACVDYIHEKIGEVRRHAERGRIPAEEADQLTRRLDAVADGIFAGLHVQ